MPSGAQLKERPILMSAPMVRAILEGRKTQTRRVAKITSRCPHGVPGDRLWVRETCERRPFCAGSKAICVAYSADGESVLDPVGFDYSCWWKRGEKLPSIFMPRWASRITLEVTGVRVERVQEINQVDALAEGTQGKHSYAELWDSLNAKRGFGWDTNPWVWVLEFKRV